MRKRLITALIVMTVVSSSATGCGSLIKTVTHTADQIASSDEFQSMADKAERQTKEALSDVAKDVFSTLTTGEHAIPSSIEGEGEAAPAQQEAAREEMVEEAVIQEPISFAEAGFIGVTDDGMILCEQNGNQGQVRLIGVSYSEDQTYKTIQTDHLAEIFEGTETIWLSFDKDTLDDEGRTWAYVWLSNNIDANNSASLSVNLVNYRMLRDGYGSLMGGANKQFETPLYRAWQAAVDQQDGLWADAAYRQSKGME